MTEAQHSLTPELDTAGELLECLQQEQAHLIQADIAALAVCAARKNSLVGRMTTLAQMRLQSLADAGYPATEAGMLDWIAQQQDPVREDWRKLLALAASGKELNRTNGLLIHQHMNRNQAGLQALRGGGQPAVYGRDGQQNVRTTGRSFVAG
ncbi:MAG: flagellar protein FlgN [Burkholderia sp.]|jgi:flagella synthesis protein FlgN|nr:flagellar protein FlgN [Burkholderia sp.]